MPAIAEAPVRPAFERRERTLRAAIYIRVSSATQEEDGTSLGTQEQRCCQHAAQRGFVVEPAHIYREVHTGTELWERPQLQRLREAVRRREINLVIAYAIDRLSRDPVHLGVLISEAEHAGVDVRFVTEPLDNSPEGQLIRFVRGYAAKVEHEKFRERSMRGKRARVEAGKLMHSKAPLYGYQWAAEDRGRYTVNPITEPSVRRIFHEAAAGTPQRRIAEHLTAEGVPAPWGGRCWDFVTIGHMLANPAYKGEAYAFRTKRVAVPGSTRKKLVRLPQDEWVRLPDGTIPRIVDDVTFAAARERRLRNRAQASRRTLDPEAYLLRGGYVRCGYCGYSMSPQGRPRGHRVYLCPKGTRSTGLCRRHAISARDLDRAVWSRVESVLTNPEVVEHELDRLYRDDPTAEDLAAVERALSELGRKQGNLARALAMFTDDEAAAPVVAQLEALRAQQRSLEAERAAIGARRAGWEAGRQRLADLQAWCRGVAARLSRLTCEQQRVALDALGVRARVWQTDHMPRWLITADIPLDGRTDAQMGQDSRLYAASQKRYS